MFLISEPVFAQNNNLLHSGSDINSYVPKSLKKSFNEIVNFKFDFLNRIPLIRKTSKYIPKSGKEAEKQIEKAHSFLNKINLFFEKNKIGRKIYQIFNFSIKISFFVLEKIIDLIKRGLDLLH